MSILWEAYKITTPKDWHYNEKLDVYQKVNGRVYVYVSRLLFGYMIQLYFRGSVSENGFCLCEARTENLSKEKLDLMFNMGEQWLDSYCNGKEEEINKCEYAVANPNGVWGSEKIDKKLYWL
jgi:hypothetical protein